MQWGYQTCQSLFARRYPPSKSITKPQQFRAKQSLVPRCQVATLVTNHDGASSSVDLTLSSPPRRSKPPLSLLIVALLLLNLSSCAVAASNSTEESKSGPAIKVRVLPAPRQAVPVRKTVEFSCVGGQPPYRWEYQVQEDMTKWRYEIRHNRDNCKPNVTVRALPEDARVRFDNSSGRLYFDWTELNDTGIYRCFSAGASLDGTSGCVELHLLVFEPTSYLPHIRIIYGLFAVVIFVASLSTAWQLWNSSAFHRKAMARTKADLNGGHSNGSPLSPVMRFFTRSRSSSANKPSPGNNHSADMSRWPVLRRRLSSIDDSPASVAVVAAPTEGMMGLPDEHARVTYDDETQRHGYQNLHNQSKA